MAGEYHVLHSARLALAAELTALSCSPSRCSSARRGRCSSLPECAMVRLLRLPAPPQPLCEHPGNDFKGKERPSKPVLCPGGPRQGQEICRQGFFDLRGPAVDVWTGLRDGIEVRNMAEVVLWHQASRDCGHGLYELGKVPLHPAGSLEHWRAAGLHQLQPNRKAAGALHTGLVYSISTRRPQCCE